MIIKNKQKSFTLIELLVVIVIIGILAGVIMISTSSSIDKANFAKAQAFSSTVQNELLSNLVSEWTFDNASNIGEDTWGNNHGTLYGSAGSQNLPQLQSTSECVFGTCLKFDGTDDYVDCGNNSSLNITKKITISMWVSVQDFTPIKGILTTNPTGVAQQTYAVQIREDNKLYFVRANGSTPLYTHTSNLLPNKWIFIIGVDDGIKQSIYIDGIKKDEKDSLSNTISMTKIRLARYGDPDKYFNGLMDDIRIYNTALSSSQIKQNYIAGLNSMLSNGNISKQEYNERINALAYDN